MPGKCPSNLSALRSYRHSPNLPQLCLKLSASDKLSLTLPFPIVFTLERQSNSADKPLVVEWSAYSHGFAQSGFVLLHHTVTHLEILHVDHSGLVDISRHGPLLVNGWNPNLWELTPDRPVKFMHSLPARYQKLLKAGETYTLLWPGGEIALWEEGGVRDHIGRELRDRSDPLILPGGPHLTFTTHTESPPWPAREEREARRGFDRANFEEQKWRLEQRRAQETFPPTKNVQLNPNAPRLHVTLDCASSIVSSDILEVVVKVRYEAAETARPVTFHTYHFEHYDYYQLGRLQDGIWRNYDDQSASDGFFIVDDPDVAVIVGQDDHFASLHPGESWTTSQHIGHYFTELPNDARVGETFRYVFIGTELDWWDWGSKIDHADTVVKLPCFLNGAVMDPKDNEGRPPLVVKSSNVVEFSLRS